MKKLTVREKAIFIRGYKQGLNDGFTDGVEALQELYNERRVLEMMISIIPPRITPKKDT